MTSTTTRAPQYTIAQILNEWKILARLGAPILIAQLAQMANGVMDTMMSGHASARDLAGVGIGTGIWVPVILFFYGILNSLQPLISGHLGGKEFHRIMPLTWQGIYFALAASVGVMILLSNVSPILHLLHLDQETTAIAQGYLNALSWGAPAVLLMYAIRGLTDGLGHTRVYMAFSLLSTVLNFPLNLVFIFGIQTEYFSLPAMGGVGCGVATSISNWIAVCAFLTYLNYNKDYKSYHLIDHWVKPILRDFKRILYLGFPIGLAIFVEVSMFCMIALFLSPLGPEVIAGHQIVLNATSIFFMVPLSLGMALTLRLSYLIGAHEPDTAGMLAKSALLLALAIAAINVPILFFGRDLLASLYTADSDAVRVASELFKLAAIFQIADMTQVTMISVLRGYKDTKVPMFIMMISFWGVCLPLGYLLTFHDWFHAPMGAAGFWTALIVGLSCAAILLTIRVFYRVKHH